LLQNCNWDVGSSVKCRKPIFKIIYNFQMVFFFFILEGARYRTWLRHYATSRKVVGSIPDEVIGFFSWPNLSSRTMDLGSTQPVTEMSTRNLHGGSRAAGA
jgi:hypothetical protein